MSQRTREALTEEDICEPSTSPWQVIGYREGVPIAWMLSVQSAWGELMDARTNGSH